MTVHLFVFVLHLIISFEISVFQASSQLQIFQKQRITEKLCNLELWLVGIISALYWLGGRALTSEPAAAAQPEPEVLGAGAGGGSDGERQLYFREEERKHKRLASSSYLQPA
jgi:hypothetical protein